MKQGINRKFFVKVELRVNSLRVIRIIDLWTGNFKDYLNCSRIALLGGLIINNESINTLIDFNYSEYIITIKRAVERPITTYATNCINLQVDLYLQVFNK